MAREGEGGQIPLTSLTISPAVFNLNIAVQHINKTLPNVYGFNMTEGVLNSSYNSYNWSIV